MEHTHDPAQRVVEIAGATYRVTAVERGGDWSAEAWDAGTGLKFGPPTAGASADEAIDRLVRWLQWQREHAEALKTLQEAESAYHQIIAGSAFMTGPEGPSPIEVQREALQRLEDARFRLDEIRLQKPDV